MAKEVVMVNAALIFSQLVIDHVVVVRGTDDTGHPLSNPVTMAVINTPSAAQHYDGRAIANSVCSWLHAHEQAQVMLGSLLVVIGIWWLIRTFISLLMNLLCPLVLVLFAVICVPALREPLLGQNYPAVINILHDIFATLAENLKDASDKL